MPFFNYAIPWGNDANSNHLLSFELLNRKEKM